MLYSTKIQQYGIHSYLFVLIVLSIISCSEDSTTSQPMKEMTLDEEVIENIDTISQGITYFKDIKPIMDAYCVDCHTDTGIAPFPLTTYDQVLSFIDPVQIAINQKTMPPWGANDNGMPFKYDIRMKEVEIELINDWIEEGSIAGDLEVVGPIIELDKGGLEKIDLDMPLPEAYTPNSALLDDYRCFVMEWPLDEKSFITGFAATPDNTKTVHHLVAFKVGPDQADLVDTFDDIDPGPGYSCFGDANPSNWDPESIVDTLVYSFVGQWAPGQMGSFFPNQSGQAVEPGSRIIIQMHYNTLAEGDLTDQSTMHLSIEKEIESEGIYLPWFNLNWYFQPASMILPADESDIRHSFSAKINQSATLSYIANHLDFSKGVKLHAIFPHMHTLGKEFNVRVVKADGKSTQILQIPAYDFNWQREYHLVESVTITNDDKLEIECSWNNTREQRVKNGNARIEPEDVVWGDGTFDEMCIAMIYITPI
jgi:hypothetical protein